MKFEDIAEALNALSGIVAARGGDCSAMAATEILVRAQAARKPADFHKAAKKATAAGLRLARPTEVQGAAAAESLNGLIEILEATGAADRTIKPVSALRDLFAENSAMSLTALAEALEEGRATSSAKKAGSPAKASRPKRAASRG